MAVKDRGPLLLFLFGEDEIAFEGLASSSDVDKRPSVMVKKTSLL